MLLFAILVPRANWPSGVPGGFPVGRCLSGPVRPRLRGKKGLHRWFTVSPVSGQGLWAAAATWERGGGADQAVSESPVNHAAQTGDSHGCIYRAANSHALPVRLTHLVGFTHTHAISPISHAQVRGTWLYDLNFNFTCTHAPLCASVRKGADRRASQQTVRDRQSLCVI